MKTFYRFSAVIAGIMMFAACGTTNTCKLADLNGEWKIQEVMGVEVAGKTETEAVVNFNTAEKTISGTAGCNRFTGGFDINQDGNNSIKFGPLAATKMMCRDMEIEDSFFVAIDAARRIKIKKDVLSLYDADGKQVVKLAR